MFLKEISQNIINTHGKNLAKIAVVFPNKRASLWMNDYLLEAAQGSPVFSPKYFSITEFFQKHSHYVLADHIQLVSLLHKSYCSVTGEKQTLDQFYAWGEILLADFDNVDKSLADAEDLFRNIGSLHEMDSIDYLKKEQKLLLQKFFHSFTIDHNTVIRQKFIALWNNLFAIYTDFRNQLTILGIAYEGMIYREVVSNVCYEDFPLDRYYFVGFNKLLECEREFISILSDKAEMKNDVADVSTVCPEAKITIAQTLTDDLQTRYIETWLKENNRITDGRRTAIVLCDEHLLPSAIYGLPDKVGPVNVTAGYPLSESQPASFIATLLELYTEGLGKDLRHYRLSYLRNLQGHPLYRFSQPVETTSVVEQSTAAILLQLEKAITSIAINTKHHQTAQSSNDQLLAEATFRVFNIIMRLKSLNQEGYLDIEPLTLARLFKQIVLTATIPFHGEPAKGIQIMGVLETRNLDFDHILMLSCNEGIMPKGDSDTSVIPYTVKKAFQLNTSDDRTSIFAYYFYRLLKRCKDVTLVYNANSSETSPGEMSRFLLNLIVNNSQQINRLSLSTDFFAKPLSPQPADISESELADYITKREKYGISPSAINTFCRCQKQFYYTYYRHLREEKEEEETMDDAAFGIFFHHAAQEFYARFIGDNITASMLEESLKNEALLESVVRKALVVTQQELYGENPSLETSGMEHLLNKIVLKYLVRLIRNDIKYCPFRLISLEQNYSKLYTVNTLLGEKTFSVGGAVDRLDLINDGVERLRVVDYKSGAPHSWIEKGVEKGDKFNTVEEMFSNKIKSSGYYRQTCLYSLAIAEDTTVNPRQLPVAPALMYIRRKEMGAAEEKYDPILKLAGKPISYISDISEEFVANLRQLLSEIFTTTHFCISEDLHNCTSCPFADLCRE